MARWHWQFGQMRNSLPSARAQRQLISCPQTLPCVPSLLVPGKQTHEKMSHPWAFGKAQATEAPLALERPTHSANASRCQPAEARWAWLRRADMVPGDRSTGRAQSTTARRRNCGKTHETCRGRSPLPHRRGEAQLYQGLLAEAATHSVESPRPVPPRPDQGSSQELHSLGTFHRRGDGLVGERREIREPGGPTRGREKGLSWCPQSPLSVPMPGTQPSLPGSLQTQHGPFRQESENPSSPCSDLFAGPKRELPGSLPVAQSAL